MKKNNVLVIYVDVTLNNKHFNIKKIISILILFSFYLLTSLFLIAIMGLNSRTTVAINQLRRDQL